MNISYEAGRKRNSGAEEYSWTENFPAGVHHPTWQGRRQTQRTWRQDIQNNQVGAQKDDREESLWGLRVPLDPIKGAMYALWEPQKKKRERGESLFEVISNLCRETDPHIQEEQRTPSRMNLKRPTPRLTVIKVSRKQRTCHMQGSSYRISQQKPCRLQGKPCHIVKGWKEN